METTVERPAIAPNDQCDRCSALANRVAVKDKLVLVFCSHHARENEETLISKGFILY